MAKEAAIGEVDVPHSIGISTGVDNKMLFMVEKQSRLPITRTKVFRTNYDYQTSITFSVFEGENPCTKDNHLLGEFSIYEIPPRKQGEEEFDVTFDIDVNGILIVTAVNHSTGMKNSVIINKKRLDADEMISRHSRLSEVRRFK